MKGGATVASLVLLLTVNGMAVASESPPSEPLAAAAIRTGAGKPDADAGSSVYEASCAACHGAKGQGTLPGTSDFAKSPTIFAQGWEQIFQRVRDGYQTAGSPMAMPPRGGSPDLTDQDLWNALAYIERAFRQPR